MIKTVGSDRRITTEDTVRFVLETKDGRDCLVTPYRVDSVKVYFVSRHFADVSAISHEVVKEDGRARREYEEARDALCERRKEAVAAASTSDLVLNGEQTVDGVALSAGDRVLVKDQADPSENGIYEVSESGWTRSSDSLSLVRGSYIFVEEGIENIGGGWLLDTGGYIEVGSTPLSFLKFSNNGDPASPDENSESRVAQLKAIKSESASKSEFFYKDAEVVKVFGGNTDPETGEFFPAWLNPLMVPSEMREKAASENVLVQVYEGDQPVVGKFELVWDPSGLREGDYFVCWSWRPTLSAETLSAHEYFSLDGGAGLTTSIPTHRTDPKKYQMLMDRYTPEMFKNYLSNSDLSPMVIKGLNDSVADGFTTLENLANQIIDLLDANATHEQLLPLLSNLFALRIKSGDPTLWRRQIKKAVPNFKKKGTIRGLKEAYSDAGMRLLRLVRLWQVVSDYTFQEHFEYDGSSRSFPLAREMLLPADSNFELWWRPSGGQWEDVTADAEDLLGLSEDAVEWLGSIQPGDSFRVLYRVREVPAGRQALEDYIRSLPLMDSRDERDQEYPPKNWNTRVVEEDDPLLSSLVPVRHPIADPVVWGWVRTEFPYSENAYNMDEYNGSKRESLNPCDIGKEFVDPCGGCQSSLFNVDLEAEGLSDASFAEALQVAEEFMPFHAVVHTFNLSGSRTEFMGPVEERIEALVTVSGGETVLAGEAQRIFNRDVDARDLEAVKREALSSFEAVASPSGPMSWHGTIKNSRVCLYPSVSSAESDLNDPSFRGLSQGFGAMNVDTNGPEADPFDSGNLLEVLGSTVRYHTIVSLDSSSAEIYGEVDPTVVGPLFEYRISNRVADFGADITQSDRIIFSDEDADFHLSGLVSQRDVDDGLSLDSPWTLRFDGFDHKVLDVLPDGTLLLEEQGPAAPAAGWQLLYGSTVKKSSESGGLKSVQDIGLVEVSSPPPEGVRSVVRVGDYICLDWGASPIFYRVKSFKSGTDLFFVEGYSSGDVGGEDIKVYRRVMEGKIGQVGYDGLVLVADDDAEAEFPISNGAGMSPDSVDSSRLMENYLLFIGSEYYTISGADGYTLTLGGRLDSYTKSGQEVDFTVYRFTKESLSLRERELPKVPKFDFDSVDRSGKAVISISQGAGAAVMSQALSAANSGQPFDVAGQVEDIDFQVEYRDGEQE